MYKRAAGEVEESRSPPTRHWRGVAGGAQRAESVCNCERENDGGASHTREIKIGLFFFFSPSIRYQCAVTDGWKGGSTATPLVVLEIEEDQDQRASCVTSGEETASDCQDPDLVDGSGCGEKE